MPMFLIILLSQLTNSKEQIAKEETSVKVLTETVEKIQSVSAEVRDIITPQQKYTFYALTEKEIKLGKKQIPAMPQPNVRKELGTSAQNSFGQHIIQWRIQDLPNMGVPNNLANCPRKMHKSQ